MITPITRKELYLAKIIGEDVDIPETAKTREELFFLKILDNSSKIPEPITREELFLAKIAGQDVELPEPKTRLELFLAKAAGVEIETPEPITREEAFWNMYSTVKNIVGTLPLTFTATETAALNNYLIYGNTVDGESVGDKTENLWNVEIVDNYSSYSNGKIDQYAGRCTNIEPIVVDGNSYILSYSAPSNASCIVMIKNSGELISRVFKSGSIIMIDTSGGNELYITWIINDTTSITSDMIQDIMLNIGSTPLPYEPYGYRVPVTMNNVTTNLYLSEPLRKVEDEADYIDYVVQKRINLDGTESAIVLPELFVTEGTNTLDVNTIVKPSKAEISGKIKEVAT